MNNNSIDTKTPAIFSSPFSKDYWRAAASEFGKPRMLAVAAMITALRVIVSALKIPLIPHVLYISFAFFANALGSMIYGPLLGLASGAISDTVSAFLFPTGTYFFPFILTEMLGSFIFGLFLYRQKIDAYRIIAARFAVVFVCNILLTPVLMRWYYVYFGIENSYKLFTLARTIKNAALFPAEAFLLILFLGLLLPVTDRLHLTSSGGEKPKITRDHIIIVICMTLVSAVMIWMYYIFYISK